MTSCNGHQHTPFSLTKVEGGHSGAELFCAETADQKYLVKILPSKFDPKHLERISEICKLYQDLGIRSLELIKYGKVKSSNQPFCFYNHIDGDNYEVIGTNCSTENNYEVGKCIGTWLETLKNSNPPAKLANHEEDLGALTDSIASSFHQVLTNPRVMRILLEYFDLGFLTQLGKRLTTQSKMFNRYTKHLVHGDIKRSNVMIDGKGNIWLIDIESMKMSYDIMNFRHQMTWFLSAKDSKKMDFLRGVFDGLYKNTRPLDFSQQLLFITILNFCEYTAHHKNEEDSIIDYCQRMQPVFPRLFKNEIIV